MTRLFSILLIIFTLGFTASLQAQTDSQPPYLYYYSSLLGGLIIERADGTDSRQIAADVIPPNMTGLSGPGWSPSEKYFAAYGVTYSDYGGFATAPYLIDLRGKSVAPWLTTVVHTSRMQWSPSGEDILLLIGSFSANQYRGLGSFVWLIDAANNKVLADYGTDVDALAYGMSDIHWDVAHQQIVFYLRLDTYNVNSTYRVTLHFDGTVLREPVAKDQFIPQVFNLEGDELINDGRTVSPHGTYETQQPLKLINTRTGETVDLPRHTGSTICRDFIWTDDEYYMITMDGTLLAGGGCFVPVMGVTNPQGKLWRELGSCSWDHPPCVGWLPERVDISVLPQGSPKSIQLDPIKIEYATNVQYMVDPALAHLMNFRCAQKYSMADIRDDDTQKVVYQLTGTTCPYNLYQNQVPEEGISVVVAEDPVHHLLATYPDGQGFGVSVWILKDGLYEPILRLNTQGLTLEFTDHNERLRARNYNGWKIYAVADILAYATTQK
jgi:hypothetical protein